VKATENTKNLVFTRGEARLSLYFVGISRPKEEF
jgi:hypothetical protein